MNNIDWKQPENSKEIRRDFVVKVEESVARAFIYAVRSQGLFVRETMVKLMKEFVKTYAKEKWDEFERRRENITRDHGEGSEQDG